MGKINSQKDLRDTLKNNRENWPFGEKIAILYDFANDDTSVTTHLYLSNFFFITASFHDILKETAVITYGKTKKIYYQAQ